MNNLTNYHSHCDFCDGHAPMELFVREAVKEGFSSYGISSHAPFPVQNGCNMQKEKMTAYLEEFRRLKRLYSLSKNVHQSCVFKTQRVFGFAALLFSQSGTCLLYTSPSPRDCS